MAITAKELGKNTLSSHLFLSNNPSPKRWNPSSGRKN